MQDLIKRCINQDKPGALDPETLCKHIVFQSHTWLATALGIIGGIVVDGKFTDTYAQKTAQDALTALLETLSEAHLPEKAFTVKVCDCVCMHLASISTPRCSPQPLQD
jgi:hypothetical protein